MTGSARQAPLNPRSPKSDELSTPGIDRESLGLRSLVWVPVVIAIGINLALFVGVSSCFPEYLRDYRLNANPDAKDYVLLGRNLLFEGHYSRMPGPPFQADVLRTPVYPLFAGGLDALGGAAAIYLVQGLLQAGSCFFLYQIVRSSFGSRAAFWASLLLATDLMMAVSNFEAMSEPLFVFLLLAVLSTFGFGNLPALQSNSSGKTRPAWRFLAGGLLLGLATLTRPLALYLIPFFAFLPLVSGFRNRGSKLQGLQCGVAVLMGSLPLVGFWIARNQWEFAVPRLTTVDTQNIVYFFGAGAYQQRVGLSLEEA